MTKTERLARKLCRAASDETAARNVSHLYGFMLTTITSRAKADDEEAVEEALQFIEKERWAQVSPRGTFMLREEGRQMLKGKR